MWGSFFAVLLGYGLPPLAAILLVYLLFIPDSAHRIKANLLFPLYSLFKFFRKGFISSSVCSKSNKFINSSICDLIPNKSNFEFKIKWVKSHEDPILKENNQILVRMREEDDQTLNVMSAISTALPKIVMSECRSHIEPFASCAIDQTILGRLSGQLGAHSRSIYLDHFLNPALTSDSRISELYGKLIKIDKSQLFISILINELERLGQILFSEGQQEDATETILNFIEFLLAIAEREAGSEQPLTFDEGHIKVAIILLAKSFKAETEGVKPYLRRVGIHAASGIDTCYILAYPKSASFLDRILHSIRSSANYSVEKVSSFKPKFSKIKDKKSSVFSKVAHINLHSLGEDIEFSERLEGLGISEGSLVQGRVVEVSPKYAHIDMSGVVGFIQAEDCGWRNVESCEDILSIGQPFEFLVKEINPTSESISLTLKKEADKPSLKDNFPEIGAVLKLEINKALKQVYVCVSEDGFEVEVPYSEFAWEYICPPEPEANVGDVIEALVFESDPETCVVKASRKNLNSDPWEEIFNRFPKGMRLKAKVHQIKHDRVIVELESGLYGRVPSGSFDKAGFEYEDFQNNLVVGQILDLTVSKVFISRRDIRLEMTRNI